MSLEFNRRSFLKYSAALLWLWLVPACSLAVVRMSIRNR